MWVAAAGLSPQTAFPRGGWKSGVLPTLGRGTLAGAAQVWLLRFIGRGLNILPTSDQALLIYLSPRSIKQLLEMASPIRAAPRRTRDARAEPRGGQSVRSRPGLFRQLRQAGLGLFDVTGKFFSRMGRRGEGAVPPISGQPGRRKAEARPGRTLAVRVQDTCMHRLVAWRNGATSGLLGLPRKEGKAGTGGGGGGAKCIRPHSPTHSRRLRHDAAGPASLDLKQGQLQIAFCRCRPRRPGGSALAPPAPPAPPARLVATQVLSIKEGRALPPGLQVSN